MNAATKVPRPDCGLLGCDGSVCKGDVFAHPLTVEDYEHEARVRHSLPESSRYVPREQSLCPREDE